MFLGEDQTSAPPPVPIGCHTDAHVHAVAFTWTCCVLCHAVSINKWQTGMMTVGNNLTENFVACVCVCAVLDPHLGVLLHDTTYQQLQL